MVLWMPNWSQRGVNPAGFASGTCSQHVNMSTHAQSPQSQQHLAKLLPESPGGVGPELSWDSGASSVPSCDVDMIIKQNIFCQRSFILWCSKMPLSFCKHWSSQLQILLVNKRKRLLLDCGHTTFYMIFENGLHSYHMCNLSCVPWSVPDVWTL